MIINHNLASMNANRMMNINSGSSSKSMEKLSSGLRINRAGDDAAGLAISEKMRGQIRGLDQASSNAQDGISMLQTAEGALNETHSILQRMRELAVQSSTDTNNVSDRGQIQKEMDQLISEVDRIANTTEFNTKKLLNGDLSGTKTATVANAAGQAVLGGDAATLATKVSAVTGNFTDGNVGTHSMAISVGTAGFVESSSSLHFKSNQKLSDLGVTDASNMTIKVDAGAVTALTGLTTSSTVQDVLDKINAFGGVTASLSEDGQISVVSNTTGATSAIALADATGSNLVATVFSGATTQAGSATNLTVKDDFTAQGSTSVTSSKTYRLTTDNTANAVVGNGVTLVHDGTNNFVAGTITVASKAQQNAVAAKADTSAVFQIGANEGQTVNVDIDSMDAEALALKDTSGAKPVNIDVTTAKNASKAITIISNAIETVSSQRSKLGAFQNRLEHTINNLNTSSENLQSSESRIRDVDMAKEMSTYSKNNILSQAAQAMLAQANQAPQQVLQLLR